MLEREHGRRGQHGHLLRIADRFERRSHRHFRLSVTDVAAKQPVHRLRTLHVPFHVGNSDGLVWRFLKFKCVFKFMLKRAIRRKCKTLPGFSLGVEFQ